MSTRFFHAATLLASLVVALALAPVQAQAQEEMTVSVKDYDVFVDLPTAFAFIKLPTGWKFIGKLDADQLRHLPAETLTSLLPVDEPRIELASSKPARKRGG